MNALVATVTPTIGTLVTGSVYVIGLTAPNSGAVTANIMGTGVKSVLRSNGLPLQAKDISNTAVLVWNGANFILANLAQDIPVPGIGFAGNQAHFAYIPTAGTPYILTASFTAPTAGTISAYSTLNSTPDNGNISNVVQVNGASGAGDTVPGASTSIAALSVAKGSAVTITSTVTSSATPPYPVSQYLNYTFVPS